MDEGFQQWKKKHQAKTCPCGATIEKTEGCNHMYCIACKSHLCWNCLEKFPTKTATYNHLTDKHDGIFDAEFVEQHRAGFGGAPEPDLDLALWNAVGALEQIDRAEFEGFNEADLGQDFWDGADGLDLIAMI